MDDIEAGMADVQKIVGTEIDARRQDALNTAKLVPGESGVEAEQVRIDKEKKFEGESALDVAWQSAEHTSASLNIGPAMYREFNDRARFVDDPEYDPRNKPEQMKELTTKLEQSGLPQELWADALGATSALAADTEIDYAHQEMESMSHIDAAGFARGTVPMFAASMLDVDTLGGLSAFKAISRMQKINRISKLVKAGKMTEEAASAARAAPGFAATRLGNTVMATEAAVTTTAVGQGINAELRPTMDAGDVYGATLMAAGLGMAVGPALPKSKRLIDLEEVSSTVETAKAAREELKANPSFKAKRDTPRGVRNNNPGNIEFNEANPWQGQTGSDGRFSQFESPEDGIRAMHKLLTNYNARGVDTVEEIINTYAPRADNNNTNAYIKAVAKDMGIDPKQAIDLTDLDTSQRVIGAIIRHENGGDYYSPSIIQEGIMRSMNPEHIATFKRKVNVKQSVGAEALETEVTMSPSTAALSDHATRFWDENPEAAREMFQTDDWGPSPVQQLGKKVHEALKKTKFLSSDYDRMRGLNSNVGNWLTYQLLESPLGIARNRRSANNLGHHIHEEVAMEVSPSYVPLKQQWAKSRGYDTIATHTSEKVDMDFMREVMLEMEERMHTGNSLPNVHPNVKELADNMDRANQKMLHYAKGADGQPAVRGMEDVEFKSGWFRRKWRGDKLAKIESEIGSDRIIQAMATGMLRVSDVDTDMALILSKAIVRRTRNKDVGTGFGEFGTVSDDGKAFMTQALMDHAPNMTPEDAMNTVERVFGTNPDRGKAGFARGRMNIDLRTPIAGTKYTLMDLVEGDLIANQERYYRGASNYAALARKGIQKNDLPSIKAAIIEEARAAGTAEEGTGKLLDDIFSYFGEGAYAGGSGPVAGRLNKLAVMSYLPQLGITQPAEIGASLGISGLKAYAKYAGETIPAMMKGKDTEALRSLQAIGVYSGDHRLVVRAVSMDDVDLDTANTFLKGLDRMTDKGMRAVGYMSGFYKITETMNAVAALTVQDFIVRSVRDGNNLNRLKDMGVDDAFSKNIAKYIDDGIVEFGEDGLVKDMHYEEWNPTDAEDAALAIKIHVNTVVQKPQRGETSNWMHGQIGSLFMNLKNFTMLAGQKQTLRNMRHADSQALMSLLYGTGTAAMAYAAKQAVNGNLDDMSFEDLARGAIQWGNMTAPPLMILDPLSYLLGVDKVPGNPFPMNEYRYGIQGRGLISMPAGASAFNQLANITRIPSDFIDDGQLGNESINALKALPVIGRSYPMIPILKSLEND